MDLKRNGGIILIMIGIILTMDRTSEFKGIVSMMAYYFKEYWPLILTFLGIYLLSSPRKAKKK